MGFNRGGRQISIHALTNDPDRQHRTCIRCGCKVVRKYSNALGKFKVTYYDRYGNQIKELPKECKSLYDLLAEEE